MTFWIVIGVMSLLALAFVLVPFIKPGMRLKLLLFAGIAIAVPLAAVLAYQKLGTPTAPMPSMQGQMPPGHPSNATMNMDMAQLADKLAAKLQANPNNAEGWALLARTYVELKRHQEALSAFEKASTLQSDPQLLADYADALALSNGGQFDKKSEDLVDQALALNPAHSKALMLKATIAFNSKNYQVAIDSWEKLLKVPGLDMEVAKAASGSIAEARRLMSTGK